MIKLLDILLEIVRESKPIKIDNLSYYGIEEVYYNFEKLPKDLSIEDVKQKPIFLGSIEISRNRKYNTEPISIRVELGYIDNKNTSANYVASRRTITLNFQSNKIKTKKGFMNALYHEIIHATDPKISNYDVLKKTRDVVKSKEKKDASDSYIKYLKRPEEFDAFSSSYVNQLEDTLKKLPEDSKNKLKSSIKVFINLLLSTQKKYPNANLEDKDFHAIKSSLIRDLARSKDEDLYVIDKLAFDRDDDMTVSFIYNIIYYLNKPSLFKKYVQRLARLL